MSVQYIDVIGQLAELKEIDYRNTLAIATLIELLIDKGLFTRQEFTRKARQLDGATIAEVRKNREPRTVSREP